MYADEIKSFRCPQCQQYISNKYDACRFCSFPLNEEVIKKAIETQESDNRKYRANWNKKVLYIGIGVFALGLVLSVLSYYTLFISGEGFYFPWSPVIALFGIGQIIMGLFGLWDERK